MTVRHARGRRTWALGMLLFMATQVAAQTCKEGIPASAPDSRYRDNGDGTVTDTATRLTWKRCPEGVIGYGCDVGEPSLFTWEQALQQADEATYAGHSDWRLPDALELATLIEAKCQEPAINLNAFPNTPVSAFWTASPFARHADLAGCVLFKYGGNSFRRKVQTSHVRLVREGKGFRALSSQSGAGTAGAAARPGGKGG